jgi:DNA gyrase/topoisomerase IV subunit B
MQSMQPSLQLSTLTAGLLGLSSLLQITGGRNGYGAKLANIFSTKFSVETCDGKRQRRFLQTFTSNMSSKSEPKITACKATDNWTCITFQPDLAKFDMQVGGSRSQTHPRNAVHAAGWMLSVSSGDSIIGDRNPQHVIH